MKYHVGDRFQYFSIVDKFKKDNSMVYQCICDCGVIFNHPIKHMGRKIGLTCKSSNQCSVWASLNRVERGWPDYSKKRYYDFMRAMNGNNYSDRLDKLCRTCHERKFKGLFHPDMQQTCLACLNGRSPEEFRKLRRSRANEKRRLKRAKRIQDAIENADEIKPKDGYIYILYSPEHNIYKIGKSNNPLERVATVRTDYGIDDLILLCIGNPLSRSFECERYVHYKLDKYRVDHIKPCGGRANELFTCDLLTASDVFLSVCQEATWLDESTRYLIKMSMPKVSIDEIERVTYRRVKYVRSDKVYANKMLKSIRDIRRKSIVNPWNKFKTWTYNIVKCYSTGDRADHRFESVYKKNHECISLGVYDSYEVAKEVHDEFNSFIKIQKKRKTNWAYRNGHYS